jgi:hypothetical protein
VGGGEGRRIRTSAKECLPFWLSLAEENQGDVNVQTGLLRNDAYYLVNIVYIVHFK